MARFETTVFRGLTLLTAMGCVSFCVGQDLPQISVTESAAKPAIDSKAETNSQPETNSTPETNSKQPRVEETNGQVDARRQMPDALDFFEKKVRPLLVDKCYNCHSADNKAEGGLRVDDRNGLLQGGKRGAAVVPGQPDKSVLLRAVRYSDPKLKMPPDFQLAENEVAILRQWIQDGVAWPEIKIPKNLTDESPEYSELRKTHWAWQPLQNVQVPGLRHSDWPRGDIDRFLLAKLNQAQLTPVPDADRFVLLRRVTFDLTGLPPTPEEMDDFSKDQSPTAFERVVDRLLMSVAFGERWGRHWLDVARFGESTGSARNLPFPHAWRYRDYVIQAFNQDKPYDQFVREQIAGDLLPASTDTQRNEQLVATGFLAIGVKDVNQRFKVRYIMDNIDEQIDTFSQAFLGLTVSCARCHDHKFDPISTREYYGIAGIFHSTDLCAGLRNKMGGGGLDYFDPKMFLSLSQTSEMQKNDEQNNDTLKAVEDTEFEAKRLAAQQAVKAAQEEFDALKNSPEGNKPAANGRPARQVARQKLNRLQAELAALTDGPNVGQVAMGLRDASTVGDTEIRIRGQAEKLGPVAPRGFLKILDFVDQPKIPANQSGRLQLAEWITNPHNPLTSRVIVNRVWQHLFGAGLVKSVDNFGVTGEAPSHPELLDYLAQRFVEEGWSIKKLVRTIVLSRAYRLGTTVTSQHLEIDPANRLLWRHSPRRLDAEEIRDAILLSAQQLEREPAQGSAAMTLKVVEIRNNGPESAALQQHTRSSRKRGLYLPLLRTLVPEAFEVFDFADQGLVLGQRQNTTVPSQALYLLNDVFVQRNANRLAEVLLDRSEMDDKSRIRAIYLAVLGRAETSAELELSLNYLKDYESLTTTEASLVQGATETPPAAKQGRGSKKSKPSPAGAVVAAQPVNPDDVEQTELPKSDEKIQSRDARTAAWASFIQALFATGEFRYVR